MFVQGMLPGFEFLKEFNFDNIRPGIETDVLLVYQTSDEKGDTELDIIPALAIKSILDRTPTIRFRCDNRKHSLPYTYTTLGVTRKDMANDPHVKLYLDNPANRRSLKLRYHYKKAIGDKYSTIVRRRKSLTRSRRLVGDHRDDVHC